jgi:hypothetical protein
MKQQIFWQILCCALFVLLTSAPISACYANQAQQEMVPKLERVDFHYVIFKNSLTKPDAPTDGIRNISLLLDEDAFTETNLRKLFQVISKAIPQPERLILMVYTSVKQVYTPEYTMSGAPTPPEYYNHHRAIYSRGKENEFFRYTLTPTNTNRDLKTVILRGKDAF